MLFWLSDAWLASLTNIFTSGDFLVCAVLAHPWQETIAFVMVTTILHNPNRWLFLCFNMFNFSA